MTAVHTWRLTRYPGHRVNQKVKFLDKTKKKECILGITSTFKGRGVYPYTLINAAGEKWNLITTVLPSPATAYYITDGIFQKSGRDCTAAVVFGSQEGAVCYREPHTESVSSCWSQESPLSLPSNGVRELLQHMLTLQDLCALKRKGKLRSSGLLSWNFLSVLGFSGQSFLWGFFQYSDRKICLGFF